MVDSRITEQEQKLKSDFAEKLAAAVKDGGCPKCGSLKHVDHEGLRQCINCGNRFEALAEKKGE